MLPPTLRNHLQPFDHRPNMASLYVFFIEFPGVVAGTVGRTVEVGWGFKQEEVFNQVVKKAQAEIGQVVEVKPIVSIPLAELLSHFDTDGLIGLLTSVVGKRVSAPKKTPTKKAPPKTDVNSFVWGLKLCRDRYVKLLTETEEKALDSIIRKVDNNISGITDKHHEAKDNSRGPVKGLGIRS